jgi:hypothetical protein
MSRFTRCTDLDQYLAALRDRAIVPVLDGDPRRIDELDAMLGGNRGEAQVPADTVLMAPAGTVAERIAQALADRFGVRYQARIDVRSLVGEPAPGNIVVVAGNNELDIDDVVRFHRRIAELGHRTALGVITGPSAAAISWLIAKNLTLFARQAPATWQLLVDPIHAGPAPQDTNVTQVVGRDAASAGLRTRLHECHHGVVSFRALGRDQAINLFDTVICASDPHNRPIATGTAVGAPVCAYTGKCYRDGVTADNMLRADAIRADVVFSNACMTWRPGHGLVGPEYQLTNGFARGLTAAYIGAVNPCQGLRAPNLLFHQAIAAGATVGQAVGTVNAAVHAAGTELPHYTLLGLPWLVLGMPSVSSGPHANAGAIEERCVAAARGIGETVSTLARLPLLGFAPADFDRTLRRLSTEAGRLTRSFQQARGSGDTTKLPDAVDHAAAVVSDSAATLAQRLGAACRAAGFAAAWSPVLSVTRATGPDCPACGGTTDRLSGWHMLFPGVGRHAECCLACGAGTDRPAGDRRNVSLRLWHEPVWATGGSVDVELTLHAQAAPDDLGNAVPAVATVLIGDDGPAGDIEWPAPVDAALPSGVPTTVPVTAHVLGTARPGRRVVRALVLVNGVVHEAFASCIVDAGRSR